MLECVGFPEEIAKEEKGFFSKFLSWFTKQVTNEPFLWQNSFSK
jgi:hypothetical protein